MHIQKPDGLDRCWSESPGENNEESTPNQMGHPFKNMLCYK